MNMLYNFKDPVITFNGKTMKTLSAFLKEKGYGEPEVKPFQAITADLLEEEKADNIIYRNDGVYLIRDGVEYRGYMHLNRYWIEKYHDYPKFHITKCTTVYEIEKRKDFVWHNSSETEVQDRSSKKMYKRKLDLCWNCIKETYTNIRNTQDFFDSLGFQTETKKAEVKVDLNNYQITWSKMSDQYKRSKNYTCENCGIVISDRFDQRHIHTDHIDGNKLNNQADMSNFMCLCALCHAYKDANHKKNFSQRRNKRELDTFVSKFRQQLQECDNKYLDQYFKDNSQVN